MSQRTAESDWKVLRKLHPVVLDRFCRRILEEIGSVSADTSKSNHQRYRAIYQLIRRRDDEMAEAFDDMRRSMTAIRVLALRRHGLLTDEELARFSKEIRDMVESILGPSAE
jgi:hypothetical protein